MLSTSKQFVFQTIKAIFSFVCFLHLLFDAIDTVETEDTSAIFCYHLYYELILILRTIILLECYAKLSLKTIYKYGEKQFKILVSVH